MPESMFIRARNLRCAMSSECWMNSIHRITIICWLIVTRLDLSRSAMEAFLRLPMVAAK